MDQIEELTILARQMLAGDTPDRALYSRLEDFVLKNGSRLRNDSGFLRLNDLLEEISEKFHLPSLASLQEGFGLDSCAQ